MTDTPSPPAPLTPDELEEMKTYCDDAHRDNEWEYLERQARHDLPRCVAEVERLRAGLELIKTKECHRVLFGEEPRYCHDDGCGCAEALAENVLDPPAP